MKAAPAVVLVLSLVALPGAGEARVMEPVVGGREAGEVAAGSSPNSSTRSTNSPVHGPTSGYQEVVVSVARLEPWVEVFTEVGAWELVAKGALDPAARAWYGWEPAASDEAPVEALLRNPGTERGFLRLIDFGDGSAPAIRPAQQSWDTGGHFDANLRVRSMEEVWHALQVRGWSALAEPIEFGFGPFRVKEVLVRAPDDTVLALIERLEPPLEGWPHLVGFSRFFNATQTVQDFDRALRFFRDTLGFKVYLEHEGASAEPGPNVLGIPHNLADKVVRRVVILSPDGGNDGSIELLSFEGLVGADRSQGAVAPNRGILALRFEVEDAEAYRNELIERGLMPGELHEVVSMGLATAKAFVLTAPEGARLEFVELHGDTP